MRELPTGSKSPLSSTRRSFVCCVGGTLAISSRNSVPPSASSKRPTRSVLASVKAPRTWPKSSLSNTVAARPPTLTVTSGLPARGEQACSSRATSPLPVPFSPVISTLASEGPTRSIISSTGCMARDCATKSVAPSPRSRRFSASRPRLLRSAAASASWLATIDSRRSLSHGFSTKSRAPRRIASTASSIVPHAVIATTGSSGARSRTRSSSCSPSCPEVVSRA